MWCCLKGKRAEIAKSPVARFVEVKSRDVSTGEVGLRERRGKEEWGASEKKESSHQQGRAVLGWVRSIT